MHLVGLVAVRQVDDSLVAAIGARHPHQLEALRRRRGDGLLGRGGDWLGRRGQLLLGRHGRRLPPDVPRVAERGLLGGHKVTEVLVLAVAAGGGLVRLRLARLEVDALEARLRPRGDHQVQPLALRLAQRRLLEVGDAVTGGGVFSGELERDEGVAAGLTRRTSIEFGGKYAPLLRRVGVGRQPLVRSY
eukprot:scaffold37416_cov33-Phaeocystis_antarctica.AAC.1